jgi:dTDP-4-amino-4,6-dideoxygalactose transaminase
MAKLAYMGGTPVVEKGIATRWPVIGGAERKGVLEVLDSGILNGPNAPQVRGLEDEFARFVGSRFCLATNSGTAALHMAVAAGGIGHGDEVITTAFTYVATALSILYQNAVPVFVDIDRSTFNIDPKLIEEKITPRTRAILPVHIHGLPCDMDEINAIARRHGLLVIEDAAQAHGSTYRGRNAGTLGDMAGFSLNATKNFACGEGGMFVTENEEFAAAARRVRLHGIEGEWAPFDPTRPLDEEGTEEVTALGWMYLTQELPSAFARAQLRRLPEFNENAAANASVLTKRLSALPGVTPPACPPDRTHVYHKYRVRLDPGAMGSRLPVARFRDAFFKALRAEGVEATLWGDGPIPETPLFAKRDGYGRGCPWTCHDSAVVYRPGSWPRTTELTESSLCIGSQSYPLFPQPRKLMDRYADAFEKVVSNAADLTDAGDR